MRVLPVSALLLLSACHASNPNSLFEKYRLDLEGVTDVRVRSGGTCHRQIDEERVLAVETSPGSIRRLTDSLDLKVTLDIIRCRCCGNPTLEFLKGQELAFSVSIHHGVILRTEESGDVELSEGGVKQLRDGLAAHGVGSDLDA
jgi:hypothetical protein